MKKHKEMGCYKKKKGGKIYTNNVAEDLIYDKTFITKMSNQDRESKNISQIPVPGHTW